MSELNKLHNVKNLMAVMEYLEKSYAHWVIKRIGNSIFISTSDFWIDDNADIENFPNIRFRVQSFSSAEPILEILGITKNECYIMKW